MRGSRVGQRACWWLKINGCCYSWSCGCSSAERATRPGDSRSRQDASAHPTPIVMTSRTARLQPGFARPTTASCKKQPTNLKESGKKSGEVRSKCYAGKDVRGLETRSQLQDMQAQTNSSRSAHSPAFSRRRRTSSLVLVALVTISLSGTCPYASIRFRTGDHCRSQTASYHDRPRPLCLPTSSTLLR